MSLPPPRLAALGAALVLAGTALPSARAGAAAVSTRTGAAATSDASTPSIHEGPPDLRDARPAPGLRTSYADVLEPALEAVVNVTTTRRRDAGALGWIFESDGGDGSSQGSGVAWHPEGIIVTNDHVVAGAQAVRVTLPDGRVLDAEVVGRDPATDLAVLRVEATDLPAIAVGDSDALRVGDVLFAIGHPLGLGPTVTMGIVSATRRTVGVAEYEDFIQTDAAINLGNSGGALVDAHGRLVGINAAIVYRGVPSFQGIGLAVPSRMIERVVKQLLTEGRVRRAWLGVALLEVDASTAKRIGFARPQGTLIQSVLSDSPAERAGLRPGDVVVGMDDRPVESLQSFRLAIAEKRPGSRVRLVVVRDGDRRTIAARLDEKRDDDRERDE